MVAKEFFPVGAVHVQTGSTTQTLPDNIFTRLVANTKRRFITIGRGSDTEQVQQAIGKRKLDPDCFIIGAPLQRVSSTHVREALRRSEFDPLDDMVPPVVLQWLQEDERSPYRRFYEQYLTPSPASFNIKSFHMLNSSFESQRSVSPSVPRFSSSFESQRSLSSSVHRFTSSFESQLPASQSVHRFSESQLPASPSMHRLNSFEAQRRQPPRAHGYKVLLPYLESLERGSRCPLCPKLCPSRCIIMSKRCLFAEWQC